MSSPAEALPPTSLTHRAMVARSNILRHALQDTIDRYLCSKCPARFISSKICIAHERAVHENAEQSTKKGPPFRCKVCGLRFWEDRLRDWHFLLHGPSPFTCPVPQCGMKFAKELSRMAHIKAAHGGAVQFRCRTCREDFECCCKLHQHSTKNHSAFYRCMKCGIREASREVFEDHLTDHMNLVPLCRIQNLFTLFEDLKHLPVEDLPQTSLASALSDGKVSEVVTWDDALSASLSDLTKTNCDTIVLI